MSAKQKKAKIPFPGSRSEPSTTFYSRKKWRLLLQYASLDLAGRCLGSRGALVIGAALNKSHHVTHLDIAHNSIGDEGLVLLADMLRSNTTIQRLNLSHNGITDVGGIALAAAFIPNVNIFGQPGQWNRSVLSIILMGNECGDDTLLALSNAAASHGGLTYIDLSWNHVGPKGTKCLMHCLQRNSLCDIVLASNQLGDEGVVYLCEALQAYGGKAQNTLALYNNHITHRGAAAVAKLLSGNEYVLEVNLSVNTLGLRGIQELSKALTTTTTKCALRSLNLSDNMIGDDGATEVARIIAADLPTLERLSLADNMITDKGACELVRGLLHNTKLLTVNAKGNLFGPKALELVEELVRTTKTLRSLNLLNCVEAEDMRRRLSFAVSEADGVHVEFDKWGKEESDKDILARFTEYAKGIAEKESEREKEAAAKKKARRTKLEVI